MMADLTAFERMLADATGQVVGPPRPVDVATIVRSATSSASPGGGSTTTGRLHAATFASSRLPFKSMFTATKFVVAAVIVALFGGFLLAGVLTQESEVETPVVGASTSPEATSQLPVMLPSEIPGGIDTGSLDTPVGPARWVRLRGDDTTLPTSMDPVPVASGGFATLDSGLLWRSSDLISWVSEPMPVAGGGGRLSLADGTYWLSTVDPASLWRSRDTLEWSEVSLEGLTPPGTDGYAWRLYLQAPLAYDGVTIVPTHFQAEDDGTFLGLAGRPKLDRPVKLTETAPGVYDVRPEPNYQTRATVRIEETGDGLRVIDDEDGTELTVLDGISMDFIDRWASDGWIPSVDGLGIVDGDQLIDLDLPDLMDQADRPTLAVDESGFVAYVLEPDKFVHVYRSVDGREWNEADTIGDDPGEPTDIVYVRGLQPQGNLVIEGEPHETLWTSPDGVVWESRHPVENFGGGDPIASGWLWIQEVGEPTPWQPLRDADAPTMWYLPKDGEPVPIDLSEAGFSMPMVDSSGGGGWISSNTLIRTFQEDEGAHRRSIWIITFDDVPA